MVRFFPEFNTMNGKILTALLRSVCDEFDVETEAELILEYLRNIATLETFTMNFELVEERTRKGRIENSYFKTRPRLINSLLIHFRCTGTIE